MIRGSKFPWLSGPLGLYQSPRFLGPVWLPAWWMSPHHLLNTSQVFRTWCIHAIAFAFCHKWYMCSLGTIFWGFQRLRLFFSLMLRVCLCRFSLPVVFQCVVFFEYISNSRKLGNILGGIWTKSSSVWGNSFRIIAKFGSSPCICWSRWHCRSCSLFATYNGKTDLWTQPYVQFKRTERK